MADTTDIGELLRHSAWMHRLARTLTRDDAAADDLVQDAWLAALQHPPRRGPTVRAWLGEVLRNALYARHRSEARRARREEASGDAGARSASAESLVGAMELQRLLAEEVLRLDEPYRGTVLSCFFEGLTPSEIAVRDELPPGTVRWRLKEGLEQLRRRLDKQHDGDRRAWLRALGPVVIDRWGAPAHVTMLKGATLMKIAMTTLVTVATAGAVTVLITAEQKTRAQPPSPPPPARAARAGDGERAQLMQRIAAARSPAAPAPKAPATAPAATPATLDKEWVRKQMSLLVPLVEECHDQAFERVSKSGGDAHALDGRLVVRFTIVGDPAVGGLVGESRVLDDKSTLSDAGLRECVQETMYAARFPPPPGNGEVVIEYPFVFAPAEPADEEGSAAVDEALTAYRERRYRDVIRLAPRLEDPAMAARMKGLASCALRDRAGALAAWNALDAEGRNGLAKLCAADGIALP